MAIFDVSFAQRDIAVVPFPYTDSLTEKRRPALIISNGKITSEHGLVWLAMITSADNNHWLGDIEVSGTATGLSATSLIRIAKLATIDATRVIRIAGKVDTKTWNLVQLALQANIQ